MVFASHFGRWLIVRCCILSITMFLATSIIPHFALSTGFFPVWLSPSLHAQESTAGVRPAVDGASNQDTLTQYSAIESLSPFATETGRIRLSIDGVGTNNAAGGVVQVEKAADTSVRSAYLLAASTGYDDIPLNNNEVFIDGTAIVWDLGVESSIFSYNYYANVTSIVKPKIDDAAPGLVNFTVTESNTGNVDGEILVVIFDDPNQESESTVVLFFGAQNVNGDSFNIRLAEPIDLDAPDFRLDLSLGISYSLQASDGQQDSQIDVNGVRLTSSAGGEDDGLDFGNGALITVGGIGDSNTNPTFPNSRENGNPRQDDELYDLRPFVNNGDTQIRVTTVNPSDDDNIFFAALTLSASAAIVGEGILVSPTSANSAVGESQTFTAIVQDDNGTPIVDRTVTFEIVSGPHAGQRQSGQTDANGRFSYTYNGTSDGTDTLVARFVDSQGQTLTSNQVTTVWTVQFLPDRLADLVAEVTCQLLTDNDGDTLISAMDSVRCVVRTTNQGTVMAMAVEYRSNLDANLDLIAGSVQPSQGNVVVGNGNGDDTIVVALGNLAAGASATVQFDIIIGATIPDTLDFISLPGYVSCLEHPLVTPGRPGGAPGAPGIVLGARPLISAQKSSSLVIDLNNDGVAGPGDTVEYSATIYNQGTTNAPDSNFIDQLDGNTNLIVGSVSTTAGDVLVGNQLGDETVDIQIGTLAPNASADIKFRARINPGLSSTVTRLANLAVCIYGNAPPACIGGPGQANSCTPAYTPLRPEPQFNVSKKGSLYVDADRNGMASPGDTLAYQIAIENSGNMPGTGVRFTDPLADYLTPIDGSVRTNRGTIVTGNDTQDRTVDILIGQMDPGEDVLISLQVQVTDALAGNISMIQNQGTVQSNELATITMSDDGIPATAEVGGKVTAQPNIVMNKSIVQTVDVGLPGTSSNDTLLYLVTIVNQGAGSALQSQFEDTLDGKTELIPGTIQSSRGTPTVDTVAGADRIVIQLNELAPGEQISIGYRAQIRDDVISGEVSNQAQATYVDPQSNERVTVLSDNPLTPEGADATATTVVNGIFLPVLIDPPLCSNGNTASIDIALVLDRSSSMVAEGKLNAAKVAAASFLRQMDFTTDQATIISFSRAASVDQQLTSNQNQLEASLAAIQAVQGTAIGEGLIAAALELQSERHQPANVRAIVLLSDGVSSAGRDPLTAANDAKSTGIQIFTIGLGSDVDGTTLTQIASAPDNYFFAPSATDLLEIYRAVAQASLCTP